MGFCTVYSVDYIVEFNVDAIVKFSVYQKQCSSLE